MNASRRICCNAANAYRPRYALRNTFFGPIGQRFASNSSLDAEPQSRAGVKATEADKRRHSSRPSTTRKDTKTADELFEDKKASDELQADALEEDVSTHDVQEQGASENTPPFQSAKLAAIAERKLNNADYGVLEYEGQYVRPTDKSRVRSLDLPWMGTMKQNTASSHLERLGAEIKAFSKWIRPTEAEIAAREAVIQQTKTIVQANAKEYSIEVFGSARNGLALASSDVDLRLYQPVAKQGAESWMPENPAALPPQYQIRRKNLSQLRSLCQVFGNHPEYMLCRIRHARYPLLHMQHKPSGIDVQIVCSNDTAPQRSRIAQYMKKHPQMLDLYSALKTLLDIRGLTDVFRGGLGSYNIFIMIATVLTYARMLQRKQPENATRNERVGREFMEIMKFYGMSFNTYKFGLRLEPMSIIRKIEPSDMESYDQGALQSRSSKLQPRSNHQLYMIDKSQPYLLCLEDPEDPTNDLGRQASGWKHIQQTIRHLTSGLLYITKYTDVNQEVKESYLLQSVGAAVPIYKGRRQIAQQYGERVLKSPEAVLEEQKISLQQSKISLQQSKAARFFKLDDVFKDDAQEDITEQIGDTILESKGEVEESESRTQEPQTNDQEEITAPEETKEESAEQASEDSRASAAA